MIDTTTGELLLSSSGARISPRLTRAEFFAAPWAAAANQDVVNEPWARYNLLVDAGEVGPFPAAITFQFHAQTLVFIQIVDASPEFGLSWESWSEEKERARRAAHDRWLASSGIKPGKYAWGELASVHDDRDSLSSIFLDYRVTRTA
jgi:hypothetical protein